MKTPITRTSTALLLCGALGASPAFSAEVLPFTLPSAATPRQELSLEVLNKRMAQAHKLKDLIVDYSNTFPRMADLVSRAVAKCDVHRATVQPGSHTLSQALAYCETTIKAIRRKFLLHAGLLEKFRELIPRIEKEIKIIDDATVTVQAVQNAQEMIQEIDDKQQQVRQLLNNAKDLFNQDEFNATQRSLSEPIPGVFPPGETR